MELILIFVLTWTAMSNAFHGVSRLISGVDGSESAASKDGNVAKVTKEIDEEHWFHKPALFWIVAILAMCVIFSLCTAWYMLKRRANSNRGGSKTCPDHINLRLLQEMGNVDDVCTMQERTPFNLNDSSYHSFDLIVDE
mmetsp:Transcript_60037/g.95344  ORF Transcript_60037/g.95344 Transcript_60037/m.95344 type:complete len:139 (-) Transcript_60037:119-535(-)